MTQPLRIAIVGYGIAGTAAAILLRKQGHHVERFERSASDEPPGAGILLHPAAESLLKELGVWDAALARGARVARLRGETVTGRQIMDFCYSNEGSSYALGIQRGALLELLRNADPDREGVRHGSTVESVDAESGLLTLLGGEKNGPYDLIVAADGARSSVRNSIPEIVARDRLYRSAAIVTLVDDPQRIVGDEVLQRFDGVRHVSVWPVGTTDATTRPRLNISINVPLAKATEWRATGEWRRVVAEFFPSLVTLLDQQPGSSVEPIMYSYRDVIVRRFNAGRVVLIADAAHSMSPQLGQGVLLALQDAAALGQALGLHQAPLTAIRHYDAVRRPQVRPIQQACRRITPMFQSESRLLAGVRDAAAGPLLNLPSIKHRMRSLLASGSASERIRRTYVASAKT